MRSVLHEPVSGAVTDTVTAPGVVLTAVGSLDVLGDNDWPGAVDDREVEVVWVDVGAEVNPGDSSFPPLLQAVAVAAVASATAMTVGNCAFSLMMYRLLSRVLQLNPKNSDYIVHHE